MLQSHSIISLKLVWEMAIIIIMLKVSGELLEISTFHCNKGTEMPTSFSHSTKCSLGSLQSSGEDKSKSSHGLSILHFDRRCEGGA